MGKYACYYDASSTQLAEDKPLVVVGLLSNTLRWVKFQRDWDRVLTEHHVPYLHMNEFTQSVGPFKAWKGDEEKRAAFIATLVRVMKRRIRKVFQYRTVPSDYLALDSEYVLSDHWGSSYSLTASLAVYQAEGWFREKHPGERLLHIVEEGDAGQSEFVRVSATDDNPPTFQPKCAPDGLWCAPFQAADLYAYESRLTIERHLEGSSRPLRKSFALLQRMLPSQAYKLDVEHLRTIAAERPDAFPPRGNRAA